MHQEHGLPIEAGMLATLKTWNLNNPARARAVAQRCYRGVFRALATPSSTARSGKRSHAFLCLEIDAALAKLLYDIERGIGEDEVMGGPPQGSA
jgi:hypothetical protein